MQIVTGIFLTMHYKPARREAFASVEYIMRDVEWGWLIRYMHSTGASLFFIVVYLHMFRGAALRLVQEAARAGVDPRHADLPRADGRSLHGLRAAVGQHVVLGRAGDHLAVRRDSRSSARAWSNGSAATTASPMPRSIASSRCTSSRCRWCCCCSSSLHLVALHEVGSNNPDGIEIKKHKDSGRQAARRHPVPSVLHGQGPGRRRRLPDPVRDHHLLRADVRRPVPGASRTSSPRTRSTRPSTSRRCGTSRRYYAMLRAVPDKLTGAVLMGAAVLLFFFLPWLDRAQGQVDPLSRLAVQALAGHVLRRFRWRSGTWACKPADGFYVTAAAHLHGDVLRVLLLMPWYRASTRPSPFPTGDLPCALAAHWCLPRSCCCRWRLRRAKAAAAEPGSVWRAGNDIANQPSLQRGARNFVNYCLGLSFAAVRALQPASADDLGSPRSR